MPEVEAALNKACTDLRSAANVSADRTGEAA
jgi:hypothetical protein